MPAQAQHSCFMCALDLRLEDAPKCRGPMQIRKAEPACMSCQCINESLLSWPQPNVACQNIMLKCNPEVPKHALDTASCNRC